MKRNIYIEQLLNKPVFEFQKFHLKTKIKKMQRSINPKFWPEEWRTIFYKGYLRFEEIMLPKPRLNGKLSLKEVLINRKSRRVFSGERLSLNRLSTLLYYSAGIPVNKKNLIKRRFYPSGGARYPLEVYIISLNTDLPCGVYHYYIKNNSLEKLLTFRKKDLSKITNIKWVKKAGCLIIITAIFKRNTNKYRDRGYRHVLSESGHLAQNLYLLSSALDIACCAIGGYVDDEINRLLDIDGLNESVVYLLCVGRGQKEGIDKITLT